MQQLKANLIEHIKTSFKDAREKDYPNENRLDFYVNKQCIPSILTYAKDRLGYIHLSHIAIVDWLEDGEFELIYIFTFTKFQFKSF